MSRYLDVDVMSQETKGEAKRRRRMEAAAPELLAALKGIMASPLSAKAIMAAHAAIAKTEGR